MKTYEVQGPWTLAKARRRREPADFVNSLTAEGTPLKHAVEETVAL
jgi:hypothetical protein